MTEYADVPANVMEELRSICSSLPDAYEEQAWVGTRWRIRKRTVAHVYTVDSAKGPVTAMTFRSPEPELGILRRTGHPFFWPGWGTNVIAMVIDSGVDWGEVRELLTESYCVMAPKKLAALIDRPAD